MAVIQSTTHKHLFLTELTTKFKQMAKENIDLQMDIFMTSEYSEYHIEKIFLQSYRQINQQICKSSFHNQEEDLVPLQEPGKFARPAVDIIFTFQCNKETAEIKTNLSTV